MQQIRRAIFQTFCLEIFIQRINTHNKLKQSTHKAKYVVLVHKQSKLTITMIFEGEVDGL
jgi:hypothetical protein